MAVFLSRWICRRSYTSSSSSSTRRTTSNIRVSANHRTHFIFGANTDVGKTVVAAGLARTCTADNVYYIKPLQCGGSDEAFMKNHAPQVHAQTLFDWQTPTSPHFAARKEQYPKSDVEIHEALQAKLLEISSPLNVESQATSAAKTTTTTTTWIETAGGVLSPSAASPENNLAGHARGHHEWGWKTQADLYQPLLGIAPVILVGDGRLGGISATLSSLEALIIRGYDIGGIVLIETGYENQLAIREYAAR